MISALSLRPSGLDCRRSDPVDSLGEPTSRRRAAATRIQTFVSSPGSASHDTSRTSLRPSSISKPRGPSFSVVCSNWAGLICTPHDSHPSRSHSVCACALSPTHVRLFSQGGERRPHPPASNSSRIHPDSDPECAPDPGQGKPSPSSHSDIQPSVISRTPSHGFGSATRDDPNKSPSLGGLQGQDDRSRTCLCALPCHMPLATSSQNVFATAKPQNSTNPIYKKAIQSKSCRRSTVAREKLR